MATPKRNVDRRIQRTRQVLQQAFKEIVHEKGEAVIGIWGIEKGFLAMSIQEITERANVNRGTFYLHFADKYMLADTIIREQFHQMVASTLPSSPRWESRTLHLLIEVVLDSFEHKYHHQHHSSFVLAPLLERATQEELTELLFTWLKQERSTKTRGAVPLETIANIVSWAIFGAALQWSQEETTMSKEQMTNAILQVITEGTACLVPDELVE
ncbi:TetR family transcriptional regulator [Reticulibacter mediterranei]|uniref:TetR family transcriptional regulator n=1 Tax=Reticulibacter mediterranei TaxID=2778369 RepID=A0A8J3IN78_9CHLR|nr:TetR/AcrR family transcriptional regulator [Reticulibacter mediterranei]GHO93795.1 TetR family transcriptional regulator [Reticulibacter mediterranei]